MADLTLCQKCGTPIPDGCEHQAHDETCPTAARLQHGDTCERFLSGGCQCDEWVCIRCCPDEVCGPLAAILIEAREDVRARAAEAELAAERATA